MAYLLDQAIELAGPKTLSGKALLKNKQAMQRGDDKTAGKYLYQAFDNLPKKHTDVPLTPKEKQLIEDQLAKLFQKNVTINCKLVDKLANKSYVHLQTGGSIVSYRYLLEALDLARLPIPKSLQKMAQVKLSKLQSTKLQSRCGQVGGSVPLIVGGVSLGLAILSAIILWIRHRNQTTSQLVGSVGTPTPSGQTTHDDIRQGASEAIIQSLTQNTQMKNDPRMREKEEKWLKTYQVQIPLGELSSSPEKVADSQQIQETPPVYGKLVPMDSDSSEVDMDIDLATPYGNLGRSADTVSTYAPMSRVPSGRPYGNLGRSADTVSTYAKIPPNS